MITDIPQIDRTKDFFDNMRQYIKTIENRLDQDHELLVRIGDITVSRIEYRSPDLVILIGQDSQGNERSICAHAHSIQLILGTQEVQEGKPKGKLGFNRQ